MLLEKFLTDMLNLCAFGAIRAAGNWYLGHRLLLQLVWRWFGSNCSRLLVYEAYETVEPADRCFLGADLMLLYYCCRTNSTTDICFADQDIQFRDIGTDLMISICPHYCIELWRYLMVLSQIMGLWVNEDWWIWGIFKAKNMSYFLER